jgi:SAM-dependent methyltransferase
MTDRPSGEGDDDLTDFGFRSVPRGEKAGMVRGVFTSVASKYDLMNDAMSGGVHRIWKDAMMDWLAPRNGQTLLDVAGGTGDIAFRFLKRAPRARATVLDMTPDMLEEGKKRADAAALSDRKAGLGGGRRHGAALCRCQFRPSHQLLRHPQRDRHPGLAERGLSGAAAGRADDGAGVQPAAQPGAAMGL